MKSSPLKATVLKSNSENGKVSFLSRLKSSAAPITLTSLVDAFSILVIYLLINFSNAGEILYIDNDLALPSASQTESLERTTIVKVADQKIYIENKEVQAKSLVEVLLKEREGLADSAAGTSESQALIIQADRKESYKVLSQVVQASHHAGFDEIRFAVLVK